VTSSLATDGRTPYAVAARELLRETLLVAARDELGRHPWGEVTMAQVAEAAGVSRQTLYNEFGSRQKLAEALVVREIDVFLTGVAEVVDANKADPRVAVAAAFDGFLLSASENPLFMEAISGQRGDLLPIIQSEASPGIERATEGVMAIVGEGWPHVSEREARLFAECVVRLAFSCAMVPTAGGGMDGTAVVEVLGPYIDRVLGETD
jgi:AcrR family transcriptional regulator